MTAAAPPVPAEAVVEEGVLQSLERLAVEVATAARDGRHAEALRAAVALRILVAAEREAVAAAAAAPSGAARAAFATVAGCARTLAALTRVRRARLDAIATALRASQPGGAGGYTGRGKAAYTARAPKTLSIRA